MTTSRQDRDLRTELLESAADAVAQHGASAVSMREVARRVGVSHQTPGFFFGNRPGLFTALATHVLHRLRAEMEQVAAESAHLSARERLSLLGVCYIHFAHDHHAVFSLASRNELLNADDEHLIAERSQAWGVLIEAIADAQSEGWRATQPRQEIALLCWTIVHGTATAWVDGSLRVRFPNLSIEQIARIATDSL
jgi:AcrR family transcriptional regulator